MVGYFEQEIKGENKRTCIEEIWEEFPAFSQYEVRAALAKMRSDHKAYREPGESLKRWRAGEGAAV